MIFFYITIRLKKCTLSKKIYWKTKNSKKQSYNFFFVFCESWDISNKFILINKRVILFYFIGCQKRISLMIKKYIQIGQKIIQKFF